MRKIRFKLRFYVMVAVLLAAVVASVLLLSVDRKPYVLTDGTITYDKQFRGVIVRSERVKDTQQYGKVVMFVAEGELVSHYDKIAEVYKFDYSPTVLSELLDIQREIKEYQEKEEIIQDVKQPDLQALNQDIANKGQEVQDVIQKKSEQDLLKLEQDLKGLLDRRKALLKDLVPSNDSLKTLYEQEENLSKRMEGWKTDVTADDSGRVSFCFDGAEELLTPETIKTLSNSAIEDILNSASRARTQANKASQPLYRLVDNFKWYVLVMSGKNGYPELKPDLKFTMSFEGFLNKPYDTRVLSVRENDDGILYTLEVIENIDSLLNARDVRVNLRKDYTGVKIPKSYLGKKDGKRGVTLESSGGKQFVPVEIEMSDSDFVVIKDNAQLKIGATIVP